MMNWLEQYIKKNRKKLDIDEPDDSFIWEGISSNLDDKRGNNKLWLKIAAGFIILLASGYAIMYWTLSNNETDNLLTLSDISEDLKNQESMFQLAVNQKMDNIKSYNVDAKEYSSFFEEIEIIDKYYADYLADLQEMGNNPRLIQAMLHYYELKIRILERMLNELEKKEYHENNRKIF